MEMEIIFRLNSFLHPHHISQIFHIADSCIHSHGEFRSADRKDKGDLNKSEKENTFSKC